MSSRILSAWFKKDGTEKKIHLSDLNDEEYQKYYRGHLFCPNYKCNAKIMFASGDTLKYFRTYPIKKTNGEVLEQHIAECEYSVEHELQERIRRSMDPDKRVLISPEHMLKVLKKAHDRLVNPEKAQKNPQVSSNSKKGPSSKTRTDPSLSPTGRAGLAVDGAVETDGKEPSIYRKSVNDLSEKDYYYTRCVDGYVQDMVFGEDYTYINLITNDNRRARVLFSEAFAVNSPGINTTLYKSYIDTYKKIGQVSLVCIGNITKDSHEISIVLDDYNALMINGKRYYGLVNDLNA